MVELKEAYCEEKLESDSSNERPAPINEIGNRSIEQILIDDIEADPEIQSRQSLNEETVSEYADLVKGGAKMPPVTVFWNRDCEKYILADGFHRYEAHRRTGRSEIWVEVIEGSRRDALLFSVGANASHGLRRTNEDKRRAVGILLADPEWRTWSNLEISKRCGVSDVFVGKMRSITSNGSESTNRKVIRGDKVITMDTARIGSKVVSRRLDELASIPSVPPSTPKVSADDTVYLAEQKSVPVSDKVDSKNADFPRLVREHVGQIEKETAALGELLRRTTPEDDGVIKEIYHSSLRLRETSRAIVEFYSEQMQIISLKEGTIDNDWM